MQTTRIILQSLAIGSGGARRRRVVVLQLLLGGFDDTLSGISYLLLIISNNNVNHFGLLPQFLAGEFGHSDPEHTVFKASTHLLHVSIRRHPELPPELPGRPLHPVPPLVLHFLLRPPLAAHPQHAALLLHHLDLHVLPLHPGNVEGYLVRRRRLPPVRPRQCHGGGGVVGAASGEGGERGVLEDLEGVLRREHQVPDRGARVGHERSGGGGGWQKKRHQG
ncbi:hypothetical protein ABFS83_02G079500 [Erythranthe nasuta]